MKPTQPGEVGAYYGAVMLLGKDDPSRVIATGREPILTATMDFEREGFVANVVFPTAVVERDERFLVYYGASDKYSGVVELDRAEVMARLE
jgi:predicted GH43/DUF377 family glycosyl hydrolase